MNNCLFAGVMGTECVRGNVTIPCPGQDWEVGAHALYLQPAMEGFDYYLYKTNATGTSITAYEAQPSWGWGFDLEAGYHFSSGNDVNVNWYHLNYAASQTINIANGLLIPPIGSYPTQEKISTNWNALNVEVGQVMAFDDYKTLRFHGGLQFASINAHDQNNNFILTQFQYESVSFYGVGPRVGADGSYNFNNGLSFSAKGAFALLMGRGSFSSNWNTVTPIYGSYISGSRTQITPELEAKLAASYNYLFAFGDLSADIGWMWVSYLQALAESFPGVATAHSNFGVSGPYVGLKWVGNL